MSLATRCPACGTVFRVVQDQLKVSQGWVRCGHCQDVFNALEALFELTPPPREPFRIPAPPPPDRVDAALADETPAAIASPGFTPEPDPVPQAAAPRPVRDAIWVDPADDRPTEPLGLPTAPATDAWPVVLPTEEADGTASASSDARPAGTGSAAADGEQALQARHDPAHPGRVEPGLWEPGTDPEPDPPSGHLSEPAPDADAAPGADAIGLPGSVTASLLLRPLAGAPATITQVHPAEEPADDTPPPPAAGPALSPPTFIRRAERAAVWRRPAVRATLSLLLLLLTGLLLGQVTWQLRDELGARHPSWRTWLGPMANALGAELLAPRALDRIVLDTSNLGRTGSPRVLRLTAELRNSASHRVRAPSLDVSFSDTNGQLLVRRIFHPAELGLPSAELAGDGLWNIDTRLDVGALRVAGYKIDVFYP